MKLIIETHAYPIPNCVFNTVAINCWTDGVMPERFMIVVTEAYAQYYKWDLAHGLREAVELRYGELLVLAQFSADSGEGGLYLA